MNTTSYTQLGSPYQIENKINEFEQLTPHAALESIISTIHVNFPHDDTAIVSKAGEFVIMCYDHENNHIPGYERAKIKHIFAVAKIVAELKMDSESVAAAILHDCVKNPEYSFQDLKGEFGSRIAKIARISTRFHPKNYIIYRSEASLQYAIYKHVLDEMSLGLDSVPALYISLAEILDILRFRPNLMSVKKYQLLAYTALKGFSALAEHLGVWELKASLQDQAFIILDFNNYTSIVQYIKAQDKIAQRFIKEDLKKLKSDLETKNIQATITSRRKHVYSTYAKMKRKNISIDEIPDLIGFRIIVKAEADCYSVKDIVHDKWQQIPGEYDDYILNPKENGYQSLHTAVAISEDVDAEFQIRTVEMNEIAEFGTAAHSLYKGNGDINEEQINNLFSALRRHLQWCMKIRCAEERAKALSKYSLLDLASKNLNGNILISSKNKSTKDETEQGYDDLPRGE